MRRSKRRAAFVCGAVASLAESLAARGSRLVFRTGSRVATVKRLAREAAVDAVVWSAAYDMQTVEADGDLQRALEEQGVRAVIVHDAPAVAPEETTAARSASGPGYRSFAPYFAAWEASERAVLSLRITFASLALQNDALPAPRDFAADAPADVEASEKAAQRALDAFLQGPALAYATNRNVPAYETSHLSAHLSFGTISARTVLARTEARAADPFLLAEERLSLAAFKRALARRDFFLQLAWFYPHTSNEPLQERMRSFPFVRRHAALESWRTGNTGYPLVDAGIRELTAMGTMHPRARAVAASFLCFDLGVDWRIGRDAWDRLLTEDDPALATGNWQWIAGVGADLAQYPRIFNPRKQARRLDPEGTYIRRWIPELRAVPTPEIFEPDRTARSSQLSLPLFDGARYPAPVVEHETVAREFLSRYAAFTRG